MAEVKWIKLYVNLFDKKKIKRIRRLPSGNDILLIWIMLLAQAGICNAGGCIFITQNVPYTNEDLADELGFNVDTIKLAIQTFVSLEMITVNEKGYIILLNWEEYQQEDKLQSIREYNRLVKQRQRQRQKEKETKLLTTSCHGQCHGQTHDCQDTDIDIDKELDIDNSCITTTTSCEGEKLYGEYGNVFLTNARYNELACMLLSKERLHGYIEDLSEAIAEGKEKPYCADCPDAHYIRIKKYHKWRKTHPQFEDNNDNSDAAENAYKEFFKEG